MSESTHIFSVRGRPVGFVPGRFGGALVAVERGYFPVSSTGYRSLAGHCGINGGLDPAALSPEFLKALAQAGGGLMNASVAASAPRNRGLRARYCRDDSTFGIPPFGSHATRMTVCGLDTHLCVLAIMFSLLDGHVLELVRSPPNCCRMRPFPGLQMAKALHADEMMRERSKMRENAGKLTERQLSSNRLAERVNGRRAWHLCAT